MKVLSGPAQLRPDLAPVRRMSKPVGFHWGVRARFPHRPFTRREDCQQAWQGLRRIFPQAFAAALMPEHVHCVDPSLEELEKRMRALSRLLRGFGAWYEVQPPEPIRNFEHLRRQIRYVHLNPCRDSLCRDPLEWEWSTHRDYAGATLKPWPQSRRILRMLGFSSFDSFHHYVSGDPSVHPAGTPAPEPWLAQSPILSLEAAALAATVAARGPRDAFLRKGALRAQLMGALRGEGQTAVAIARHFGVHPTAVREGSNHDRAWLEPVLRTLADRRLFACAKALTQQKQSSAPSRRGEVRPELSIR